MYIDGVVRRGLPVPPSHCGWIFKSTPVAGWLEVWWVARLQPLTSYKFLFVFTAIKYKSIQHVSQFISYTNINTRRLCSGYQYNVRFIISYIGEINTRWNNPIIRWVWLYDRLFKLIKSIIWQKYSWNKTRFMFSERAWQCNNGNTYKSCFKLVF